MATVFGAYVLGILRGLQGLKVAFWVQNEDEVKTKKS